MPGGGNGGESTKSGTVENGHEATTGAAGGGGMRAVRAGAAGTYASSIGGDSYGPFSGGTAPSNYIGGGGGGAGAAAASENGGEGLASDITGVSLVYGSGGGGGGSLTSDPKAYSNGTGGDRAGTGAYATVANSEVTDIAAPTVPIANSGGGGGGGLGGGYADKGTARYGSSGADGIVVIRYDWTYNPNPPVFGFKMIIQ